MNKHLKKLAEIDELERVNYVEMLELKNYGSNELTETEMWVLTNASKNSEYLTAKLKEGEELTLDDEAPEENANGDDADLTLDDTDSNTDLTDNVEENTEEGDLTLDDTNSNTTPNTDSDNTDKKKIETSKEGIGILPLLGEIQEKLATGKPSEVELAALKALKKLVD